METNIVEKRRRRTSAEERARVVAEYHQSGKTQGEFAREAGISLATLAVWLRRSREKTRSGKLIEVTMPAVATNASVEIIFSEAVTMRVPVGVPTDWIVRIVRALRCGG